MSPTSRSALLARAERSAETANRKQLQPPTPYPRPSVGRSRPGFSRAEPPIPQRRRTPKAWISRNRRLCVALLLCLAAGLAVQQLTPASAAHVSVLVAARDLPAGASLKESDFTPMDVAPELAVPAQVKNPAGLVGRQLASPLSKGQIPTDSDLLGPGLLTGTPAGSAAVPLRMADPSSIQLLSPGQLVNVVLTAAGSYDETRQSQVLAGPVPVLWTSAQGGKAGEWLGTKDTDGLVVVAANPQQAEKLAGASTQGKLFFVLVSP
ncbi:RcpC/CpaB family pilus assembly protein [Paenarthrobacter sp. NPDC057355]|uniref:RcpC/CpaB family pilus assembly protein n=1 Tax=Paenarthrobacter sp. NPDC057355 TaxID=3346105 RepID=UPI00362F0130